MTLDALDVVFERERQVYLAARPRSVQLLQRAARHFAGGVPMHWMRDWPAPVPLYVQEASGATLVDVDGHSYTDFCLGDTAAMFGHSPPAVAEAIARQSARGLATMLPEARIAETGELLTALFGLHSWQITQTATEANRAVLRRARQVTGRPKVLVFDGCYHGTVDETLAVMGPGGRTLPRPGQVGPIADVGRTTAVVEFNDADAVEQALSRGDIACVLAEPVMTNAGMVLPMSGFLEELRELCTAHGALLALDETHTLSSGLGGYSRSHGLTADFLVCGKAIAGGVSCAVWGASAAVTDRIAAADPLRESGHSGIGTTLSANPLAVAALHACLAQVMTAAAYAHMETLAVRLADGISRCLASQDIPWQVTRVGARLEFGRAPRPRTARESLAAIDHPLQHLLQLHLLNRGFLLTPFHNMMLLSPATTAIQVDAFLHEFDGALALFGERMRTA